MGSTTPQADGPVRDGPEWPRVLPGERVVFLVDASSRLERRLLGRWINRTRPESFPKDLIEIISIPASRRRRKSRVTEDLEAALATPGDPLMCPLRVIWRGAHREDGQRGASALGLLTIGDPRDPNWIRQAWVYRRAPDRCVLVTGEPATASNLRARWTASSGPESSETAGFADFVRQKATLALERAERVIRGARYKVPRLVHEEILGRPAFRGGLARIAIQQRAEGKTDASVSALAAEATSDLKEIAATHSPLIIDLVISVIRWLYTLGYDEKLVFDPAQMKGIAALEERHPVVFLPTHKHNLDHLVLQYALHEHGLPPNHTAGGINMNFFPIGQVVRRAGVFFIRRTFRDDPVYKHTLAHYIDYLIEKRFSLEWYIEGGRSRSGKLLPPKYGLLTNVVDAYRRGKSDDVYLVPVSIAYDQIQGLGSYVDEQKGGAKQSESFSWFLGVVRQMKRSYGRIHIAFGDPLSLREQLGESFSTASIDVGENVSGQRFDLEKLAFEVSDRINRVTPITPTSLVTLALLGTTGQALTVQETRKSIANLLENVRMRGLPTTADFHHLESDEGVEFTLNALVENDVVTLFDEGLEPVYGIADQQQLSAAYYRNTIVHFFVGPAIAELALLHAIQGERVDALPRFWEEVMRLRDILKFEFFFPEKEAFRTEVRQIVELNHRNWEKRIETFELDPQDMIRRTRPYMSHRVLRPFLESYRVAADQLTTVPMGVEFDEKRFLKDCLGLGRQYELQKRIHAADSVSKALFQTALKLATNRRLLASGESDLSANRQAFADEIRDAVRRVDIIVALAAGRRAGFAS
jgi:glycerol-3-phosphate O-acyltransferase